MRNKRKRRLQFPRDYREDFLFEGRWITPEEAHAACKDLMDRVDSLPKADREYIHEHGRPRS